MSAILYQLTVTDIRGMVILEEIYTSPIVLADQLPEIKKKVEEILESKSESVSHEETE